MKKEGTRRLGKRHRMNWKNRLRLEEDADDDDEDDDENDDYEGVLNSGVADIWIGFTKVGKTIARTLRLNDSAIHGILDNNICYRYAERDAREK